MQRGKINLHTGAESKPPWVIGSQFCQHPHHEPPMHISLRPGESRTHRCPACGYERVITGGGPIL